MSPSSSELQRDAHDAAELEPHDGHARVELGVVQGIADDHGLPSRDDPLQDAVAELARDLAEGALDRLPLDIPRAGDAGAVRPGEDDEALVGARELDDLVEERLKQGADVDAVRELR